MSILEILGTAFGIGLLAGIRLYATVLAVGLGIRWGIFELPLELQQLHVLAETPVLALAGTAYLIEFFADKIPWLDSAWDTLHTFIRPLGAALLGAAAFGSLDPKARVLLAILCGGVALAGHGSKAANRLVINHSPEPFSNAAVSLAEDALVPPAVWFVMAYPVATLVIVSCFLALFLWLAPKVFRLMRVELVAIACLLRRLFGSRRPVGPIEAPVHPVGRKIWAHLEAFLEPVPNGYSSEFSFGARAAATGSVSGLRHAIGYLGMSGDNVVFVGRRWFASRTAVIPMGDLKEPVWRNGLLMNQLILPGKNGDMRFLVFKFTCHHSRPYHAVPPSPSS